MSSRPICSETLLLKHSNKNSSHYWKTLIYIIEALISDFSLFVGDQTDKVTADISEKSHRLTSCERSRTIATGQIMVSWNNLCLDWVRSCYCFESCL